jgi:hypothetical protein
MVPGLVNAPMKPSPSSDRAAAVLLGCTIVVGVALIAFVGVAVVLVVRARPLAPPSRTEAPATTLPSTAVSAPEADEPIAPTTQPADAAPAPTVSWSPSPGMPLFLDVNGDGVDDLIGRVVVTQPPATRTEVRVAAYDGKTFAMLWTSGALGEDPFATRDIALAAGHGHVAVMDGKARYTLLDARTGEEVLRGEGEEAGRQSCTTDRGAPALWLGPQRGAGVLFDLKTKRATVAPRPDSCAAPRAPRVLPTAASTTLPWEAGGMIKLITLRDGPIRFAFGINNWTKKVVTVAAFGAGSKEPLWRRPVRADAGEAPPVDYTEEPVDLAGGRAYVVYPVRVADPPWIVWRMQVLDVMTGGEIWDVVFEGSGRSLFSTPVVAMTEERLYVAFEDWLQVHARDTGKVLARIGR